MRYALAALAGCAALGLAVVLAAGGKEGGSARSGRLAWAVPPVVYRPGPALPRDRVLTGVVRNPSLAPLELRVAQLRVVDERGRVLASSARFSRTFAHGLYPPGRGIPAAERELEARRLGETVRLEPGRSTPLTVAWRLRPRASRATRIELGGMSLTIPRGSPRRGRAP